VTQGALWTMKQTIPPEGAKVDVTADELKLAPRAK
jgi:hypothetical protein